MQLIVRESKVMEHKFREGVLNLREDQEKRFNKFVIQMQSQIRVLYYQKKIFISLSSLAALCLDF